MTTTIGPVQPAVYPAAELNERRHLFIGGTEVPARDLIEMQRPSDLEPFGIAPQATTDDVDAAVAAARAALGDPMWSRADSSQRSAWLRGIAEHLRERQHDIAALISNENGTPITLSVSAQVGTAIAVLDYYADLIASDAGDTLRLGLLGRSIVRQAPVGVVAAVVPWNYPLFLTVTKVAPALAAGCVVVLKPAPETSLDAFVLADAAQAVGLPAGVINVVPADREASAHLVAHPGVDKVAFTGSTTTGRAVAQACAQRIARVSLELGGKSAAIVLPDADLDQVAVPLTMSGMRSSGQICIAQTRVLAPRERYAEVVNALTSVAESLRVGDPHDPDTVIGPLVSQRQRDVVEGYVASALAEGARLTTGGHRAGQERGWFHAPTVLADVEPGMRVHREEIFGPVVCVLPYRDEEHAVQLANDSDYGLAGSVWSNDIDHATAVAARIETGTVGINGIRLDPAVPFGGVKQSGYGRELGPEGLASYREARVIHLPIDS